MNGFSDYTASPHVLYSLKFGSRFPCNLKANYPVTMAVTIIIIIINIIYNWQTKNRGPWWRNHCSPRWIVAFILRRLAINKRRNLFPIHADVCVNDFFFSSPQPEHISRDTAWPIQTRKGATSLAQVTCWFFFSFYHDYVCLSIPLHSAATH